MVSSERKGDSSLMKKVIAAVTAGLISVGAIIIGILAYRKD